MSAEQLEQVDEQIDNFNIDEHLAKFATATEAEVDDEIFEDL